MLIRFLLFMLFSTTLARACSCVSPPVANSYRSIAEWQVNRAPVIFEGKVESIRVLDWPVKPVAGETISMVPRLRTTFNAVYVYRGGITGDAIIETSLSGVGCEYDFEAGESYLVFAWKEENGKLFTGLCSGTKLLQDSGTALRFLRGEASTAGDLADPKTHISKSTPPVPQLCGKISAPPEIKPSSIKVFFWSAGRDEIANFRFVTASVHSDGNYCTEYLRPGKYLIGAITGDEDSGSRYMSYYPGVPERSQANEIDVTGKGITAHADFSLLSRPLYSVHGYLRGVPEKSTQPIKVMLLSVVQDRFHIVAPVEIGPHGLFEIEDVPPGRYTIFAMTQNEDNALIALSEGVEMNVAGNIEGFSLDYVEKK